MARPLVDVWLIRVPRLLFDSVFARLLFPGEQAVSALHLPVEHRRGHFEV